MGAVHRRHQRATITFWNIDLRDSIAVVEATRDGENPLACCVHAMLKPLQPEKSSTPRFSLANHNVEFWFLVVSAAYAPMSSGFSP